VDCRLNVGLELNGNSFCDIGAWKGLAPGCWCTGGAMGRLVENTTSEIVNGRPEAEVERGGISIHAACHQSGVRQIGRLASNGRGEEVILHGGSGSPTLQVRLKR